MTYEKIREIVLEEAERLRKNREMNPQRTTTSYTPEYAMGKISGMLLSFTLIGEITPIEASFLRDEAFDRI